MYKEKLKVLVTGASGMLGAGLAKVKPSHIELFGISRSTPENPQLWNKYFSVDLLDKETVKKVIKEIHPHVIIHTAAITDVDLCESNPELAKDLHVDATKLLVELSSELGAFFLYISTDILYDSAPGLCAVETDTVVAGNVYAVTKLAGEKVALNYSNCMAVRTNIFGFRNHGPQSFGEWVLEGLKKGKPLTMFTDVYFSPISTYDLAKVLFESVDKKITGLYNVGCSPALSKYDFAVKVSQKLNISTLNIVPIKLKDKELIAQRPSNLSMDSSKIEKALGRKLVTTDGSIEEWLEISKGRIL